MHLRFNGACIASLHETTLDVVSTTLRVDDGQYLARRWSMVLLCRRWSQMRLAGILVVLAGNRTGIQDTLTAAHASYLLKRWSRLCLRGLTYGPGGLGILGYPRTRMEEWNRG